MDLGSGGWLVAAVSFALAFGVSKLVSTAPKRRRDASKQAQAEGQQSRQVRRAQARKRQR